MITPESLGCASTRYSKPQWATRETTLTTLITTKWVHELLPADGHVFAMCCDYDYHNHHMQRGYSCSYTVHVHAAG